MGQRDQRAIWIATENIARFELKLKKETDTVQRDFLEGLLALEREKLKALERADQGGSP